MAEIYFNFYNPFNSDESFDSEDSYEAQKYLQEFEDEYRELPSVSRGELFLRSVMKEFAIKDWIANGHGTYSTINNKIEFKAAAKKSKHLVLYCYTSPRFRHDGPVEKFLKALSKKHIETRFCKADVTKAYSLRKYLKVKFLPTIVLCRESKPIAYLRGYEDYSIDELEWRMSKSGIIDYDENLEDSYEDSECEIQEYGKKYKNDIIIGYKKENSNNKYRYYT